MLTSSHNNTKITQRYDSCPLLMCWWELPCKAQYRALSFRAVGVFFFVFVCLFWVLFPFEERSWQIFCVSRCHFLLLTFNCELLWYVSGYPDWKPYGLPTISLQTYFLWSLIYSVKWRKPYTTSVDHWFEHNIFFQV